MNNLIIMCGLPGSGKSSYVKRMQQDGVEVVSTDSIREEINGDARDQSNANKVFEVAFERIKDELSRKHEVYFDATNIHYKKRMDLINRFKKYYKQVGCVFTYADFDECMERNKARERVVPDDVMKRMYHSFYVPQMFEGFDEIQIINNSNRKHDTWELNKLLDIDQENPHHKLSLLEHCTKTGNYLAINPSCSKRLVLAGYLHDIGKVKTKTFVNTKGETTEIAHYYNHEKVGAYDSFVYTDGMPLEDRLYIAQLIQWHMTLHNKTLNEKTILKYINLLGKDFWNDLELLNSADLSAH